MLNDVRWLVLLLKEYQQTRILSHTSHALCLHSFDTCPVCAHMSLGTHHTVLDHDANSRLRGVRAVYEVLSLNSKDVRVNEREDAVALPLAFADDSLLLLQ